MAINGRNHKALSERDLHSRLPEVPSCVNTRLIPCSLQISMDEQSTMPHSLSGRDSYKSIASTSAA